MPADPRWITPMPKGITGSYGNEAISWAKRQLGLQCRPWQARVIRDILRHDRTGDLIARVALISTGRQNGKSVVCRIIVGWILDEGYKKPAFAGWRGIRAAAHDAKQARITYDGVRHDMDDRADKATDIRTSIYRGTSSIPHRLDFDTVTSLPGSARGLSLGLILWDEVLTQRDHEMWATLGPTQIAQRSPLMLLTSSAGHPDSVLLRSLYDRLVRLSSGDDKPDPSFYGAWWQAEEPDEPGSPIDWGKVALANPGKLPRAALVTEHGILPADQWNREHLNIWIDQVAEGSLPAGAWSRCRTAGPLEGFVGAVALGVDVQPGWERASIYVAGIREDERIGVELYRDFREDVTAERIIEAVHAFDALPVVTVAYEGISPAGAAFLRDADTGYTPWEALKPGTVVIACMDVVEMILSGRLAHDDRLLDAQIPLAARRAVGADGAFRFGRAASLGPIDGVMAATMAAHAIAFHGGYPSIT